MYCLDVFAAGLVCFGPTVKQGLEFAGYPKAVLIEALFVRNLVFQPF